MTDDPNTDLLNPDDFLATTDPMLEYLEPMSSYDLQVTLRADGNEAAEALDVLIRYAMHAIDGSVFADPAVNRTVADRIDRLASLLGRSGMVKQRDGSWNHHGSLEWQQPTDDEITRHVDRLIATVHEQA
jgi:hypothetical protein